VSTETPSAATSAAGLESWRGACERQQRAHDLPGWLAALRADAAARFLERGFPTTRDEAWRETPLGELPRTAYVEGDPGLRQPAIAPTAERLGFGGAFRGREAVFVNGVLARELSSFDVEGVALMSLRELLREGPDRLADLFGRLAGDGSAFAELNTALFADAACLFVEPGARPAGPLHLVYLSSSGPEAPPSASFPRTLVLLGRASEATLVESYGGPNDESYLTAAVTEIVLEDAASLRRVKLERESLRAAHVARVAALVGRDARLADFSVATGGALARTEVEVALEGEGAECTLDGLFVAEGGQLLDTRTSVDHKRPHGTSRQLYKGVLGGRSRGVFRGAVRVRPGAQKTDAQQTNKNLLLSREALVHSTPQLEILADDVKCKHGSTTGQLDPAQLFYLRSRGIGEQAARSLLTYAFASDVVGRLPVPVVREALESFLRYRLPQAPQEAIA
jgi:Fe-S cluster assembly protein SufD